MTTYKYLTQDGLGPWSKFDFSPYLPGGERAGQWLPPITNLEPCRSGTQWQCEFANLIGLSQGIKHDFETLKEVAYQRFLDARR